MSQHREEKMKRQILVVPASKLYHDKQFEGFLPASEYNFEQVVLENFEYQVRGAMEIDPSFQQAIPYGIIVNNTSKKIVAYQRGSSESHSGEQRLYGKRSLGVGGHIELEEKDAPNPLHTTLIKEIHEEIGIHSITDCKVLGYINDNSDEVGKVHFGVLYVVETDDHEVMVKDGEMKQVYFKTAQEIDDIMQSPDCDVESRSRIAWNAYKQSFGTN